MPDRPDANEFSRFVDIVNHAVHVAFGAVQHMPQLGFAQPAFGSYRAPARKTFERDDRILEPEVPASDDLGVVRRDSVK
jgi:hypothetical protein